jgi:DNA-binding ferritin-like protein (Dps family)
MSSDRDVQDRLERLSHHFASFFSEESDEEEEEEAIDIELAIAEFQDKLHAGTGRVRMTNPECIHDDVCTCFYPKVFHVEKVRTNLGSNCKLFIDVIVDDNLEKHFKTYKQFLNKRKAKDATLPTVVYELRQEEEWKPFFEVVYQVDSVIWHDKQLCFTISDAPMKQSNHYTIRLDYLNFDEI